MNVIPAVHEIAAVHEIIIGRQKGPVPDPKPVAQLRTEAAPPESDVLRSRPAPTCDPESGYAPVIPMPPRRRGPREPSGAAAIPGGRPGHSPHGADGASAGSLPGGIASDKAGERAREEARLVRVMAGKIGQAAIEVLAGTRPIQQLARWLDPRSFDALLVRAALTRAAQEDAGHGNVRQLHRNPTVRSVHCSAVGPGIYESSLVVSEQLRQRALAMRLEQDHGVWKVTALEIG